MAKSKILIAVPTRGWLHPYMVQSLMQVSATFREGTCHIEFLVGEGMICRARSRLAAFAVAHNFDGVLFWDDDIMVGTMHDNPISLLVGSGKDVVGGLYSTRGRHPNFCASRIIPGEPDDRPVVEVEYLAGGFMFIRKRVLLRMGVKYPATEHRVPVIEGEALMHALFSPFIHEGEYLSEDWAFCQRWRGIDGHVFADKRIKLVHWGMAAYEMTD